MRFSGMRLCGVIKKEKCYTPEEMKRLQKWLGLMV